MAAIQEAKTQDAVDKALQAALASINSLQATPKEDPAPEEPKQPEEPNYDKAMASLTEAIERKTAELGDDKEAKKKLVALTEQALTAIQEAKTQDAVDKALQAALASINELQATPKEEPAPEEPAQPEEPSKPEESKVDYHKAIADLTEAIEKKATELADDVAAQEKLVELGEQALATIQEAKTQDAVDKALQAALASINELQATPKEEPAPEKPTQPEEPAPEKPTQPEEPAKPEEPTQPEVPSKPEEPKLDYDKAMASLSEAIKSKTAELGDDKEAKKKLVELAEQALAAIEEAKTQDAVDKALQAALTSINNLQATPKEEPSKPEEPTQPEVPSKPVEPKLDYDKAMASLSEAIKSKTAELGDDKEAKKKLVELAEQALAAIEEAKTQDAVDKALKDALTSINNLQATPKEEPAPEEPSKPEEPARPEDPSKPEEEVKHSNLPAEGVKELSVTQPSLEVTTEPIAFNTIRRENSLLPKGKEQVVSEGKDGQVTTYVEVDGSDRKVVKVEREEAQDRIVEVGTQEGTAMPTEGVMNLDFNLPNLKVEKEPIAFKTVRRENADLAKGKEQVVSEGKDGQVTTYVEVDGDNRKVLKVEREEAQDRIVEVGTKEESPSTDSTLKVLKDSSTNLKLIAREGDLNGGSVLEVDKVANQVLEGRRFDAYQIQLKNEKGELVQLKGAALVQVAVASDVANVYAMNANQELQEVKFEQKGSALEFVAPHLGVYAVVYKDAAQPSAPANVETPTPQPMGEDKPLAEAKGTVADSTSKQLPATGEEVSSTLLPALTLVSGMMLFFFKKDMKD